MAKSALSNSILYGIGSLVKACASFFLLPLYTSVLGATQYGLLNVLQTASIIISTIITLALERSLYRLYHDYKTDEGKMKFLSTVFIAINGIGLFVILLFVLFGSFLTPYLGGVDFMTGLLPVVLYSYVNALINYCLIVLQTKQEGGKYVLVSLLFVALYNILCVAFLYLYSPTYHSMVYATLITTILVLPVSFSMVRHQIRFYFNTGIIKCVLKFTAPVLGMILFSWILHFSDRLFLANMTNLEDVGLYSFSAKVVSTVPLFCGAVFQSYTPYFFSIANSMPYEQAKIKLQLVNDTIIFLTCIICIVIAFVYNFLLHTIFSEEYIPSLDFFYFLLIGAVVAQQTGLLNGMLYQNKKTGKLAIISIIGGILSVCFNLLLITTIGRIGAAVSNLVVSSFIVGATYLLAKKEYYIPYNYALLSGGVATILLMCICDYMIESVFIQLEIKLLITIGFVFIVYQAQLMDFTVLKKIIYKSQRRLNSCDLQKK
ncbi:MAG: oligosaccharide flippase family protein [Bacteroidaceae bacterium]|nr:oligosaccharide flippase family protein [Bacteroidaceae bacterium]